MKAWKLTLVSILFLATAAVAPKQLKACPWPPCGYVCQSFGTYYCYYDECCQPSCCAYNDWSCINPCSP